MGCTGNFPCQTFLDALSKMNSKDCVQPTYALDVTSSLRYFGILISQSNTCFFTNPLGQTCFQLFPTDLVMLHFCFRLEPGDFPTNLSQSGPGTNTLVHLDLLNASSKDKCILPRARDTASISTAYARLRLPCIATTVEERQMKNKTL